MATRKRALNNDACLPSAESGGSHATAPNSTPNKQRRGDEGRKEGRRSRQLPHHRTTPMANPLPNHHHQISRPAPATES
jgi:hypothetical protein